MQKLTQLAGLFDVIVDGSGGESLSSYIKLINIGGIISLYGSTNGPSANVTLPLLFLKNAEIRGSTMGSDLEFKKMVQLVSDKKIIPVVDSVRPFSQVVSAFDDMRNGSQFGKLVIEIDGGSKSKM